MRLTIQLLLGMALMPALGAVARAEGAAPVHVATYIEVAAASIRDGSTLLTQYREASRKESGNMRVEVAREIGRPNRFVVLEIWKDQAAFDAHGKAAGTTAFRDKLKAIQIGPYDERVHNTLNVGPNDAVGGKRAVFVVSHVDVPPPRKDECIAALNPLTVVEAWSGKKAYDGSRSAEAQRQFRDKLGPMLGALYDERLYRALD